MRVAAHANHGSGIAGLEMGVHVARKGKARGRQKKMPGVLRLDSVQLTAFPRVPSDMNERVTVELLCV